jgi:ABC-type transport system substrate-binding protein
MGVIVRPVDPFLAHSTSWFASIPGSPRSPLWSGFSDKTVIQLARQASMQMNAATAATTYQQIDQRLWLVLPSYPIFVEPTLAVWTTSIDGLTQNPYPPGTLASLPTWKVIAPVGG